MLDRKALACSVFNAKLSTRTVDADEYKFVEVGPAPIKLVNVARVHCFVKLLSHRLEEEAGETYLSSIHWHNTIAWRSADVVVPAVALDVKLVHRRVDVWVEELLHQCLAAGMQSRLHDWCCLIARVCVWASRLYLPSRPLPLHACDRTSQPVLSKGRGEVQVWM